MPQERPLVPDYFDTRVAKVLFDEDPLSSTGKLDAHQQEQMLRAIQMLLESSQREAEEASGRLKLWRRIDRILMPVLSGPFRRRLLKMVTKNSRDGMAHWPQGKAQAALLSKAVFLSGALSPQALRRLEMAIRAELGQGGKQPDEARG